MGGSMSRQNSIVSDASGESTPGGKKKGKTLQISEETKGDEDLLIDEFTIQEEVAKRFKTIPLSTNQETANLILNFLNQICIIDDKLTAKQILKNNRFFSYLQIARVVLDDGQAQFNLSENM